jgi:hypothetical protein
MLMFRRIGALVLAVAAVAVWFGMAPSAKVAKAADFGPQISSALANYRLNNANAEYSPQQQVVNGWVAKDLLTVLAREQNAALSPASAPRDDRVPAELLLAVLGLALFGATTLPGASPAGGRVPAPATAGPDTEAAEAVGVDSAPTLA